MFLALAVATLALTASWRAEASGYYFENGMGLSQYRVSSDFFGVSTTNAMPLGFGFSNGVYFSFTDGEPVAEFQLGLLHRVSTAQDNGVYLASHAPFAVGRLQVSRAFISAGISPLVYKRTGDSFGFNFDRAEGAIDFLVEAGLLWPLTPKFSLGVSTTGQLVQGASGFSPKPLLDHMFLMRFYFGGSTGVGRERDRLPNEFHGWRYPFGREMR